MPCTHSTIYCVIPVSSMAGIQCTVAIPSSTVTEILIGGGGAAGDGSEADAPITIDSAITNAKATAAACAGRMRNNMVLPPDMEFLITVVSRTESDLASKFHELRADLMVCRLDNLPMRVIRKL